MDINTAIYIRVSTEEQSKDGFSINAQKDKLTKYALANDWNIIDYYIDDGISGKDIDGRPEVKRMINDIKEERINNVLIYKLDRLTRSVRDLIDLIEIFERYNCTFNSQTERIDTSNAVGRMFIKIIGIFAEFERENLAERVSFGYEQKTREGNYTNTNGVYGYDYIVNNHKLVVNENERILVNRIYDLYLDGLSYFKISKLLNEERIPTKRGGTWAPATIKSILSNPLYIGKVRYGLDYKNKDKSFITDGNDIQIIIDKDKWNHVQDIIDKRTKSNTRRHPSDNSYFFHTIRCGECKSIMNARQQIQNGKLYITYKCSNKNCLAHSLSHINMEKAFINYLGHIDTFSPNINIMNNKEDNNEKLISELSDKLKRLENKKNKLRTDFINDLITREDYQLLSENINIEISKINDDIKELNKANKINNESFTYNQVKDIVVDLKLNWSYLNNKEKKQFLERFIDYIEVTKDNHNVIINTVKFIEVI